MNCLPTTYWGTQGWWDAYEEDTRIEVMESFPKQTYRNRCLIYAPDNTPITLSVPVKKVEHKQLTRDVEVSNQQRWQHQHWNAILSAYKKTPYFDYYADFILPLYEREWRFLLDLNAATFDVAAALRKKEMPGRHYPLALTTDWTGEDLDRCWGNEQCILDCLFKKI